MSIQEEIAKWAEENFAALRDNQPWGEKENEAFANISRLLATSRRAAGFIKVARRLPMDRRMEELKAILIQITGHNPEDNGRARQQKPRTTRKAAKKELKPEPDSLQAPTGERPAHYDQWLDKMSPELKKKYTELPNLYAQMAQARKELDATVEGGAYTKQDVSAAARLTVAYEKKILAIHNQADLEWDKLTKKKVSDEAMQEAEKLEEAADKEIAEAENACDEQEKGKKQSADNATPARAAKDEEDPYENMTYKELVADTTLPELTRKYYIERRTDVLRKRCEKIVAGQKMTQERIGQAAEWLRELSEAGKRFNKKTLEALNARGVDISVFTGNAAGESDGAADTADAADEMDRPDMEQAAQDMEHTV